MYVIYVDGAIAENIVCGSRVLELKSGKSSFYVCDDSIIETLIKNNQRNTRFRRVAVNNS